MYTLDKQTMSFMLQNNILHYLMYILNCILFLALLRYTQRVYFNWDDILMILIIYNTVCIW